VVVVLADRVQVLVIQDLLLDALHSAEDAPGGVVVDTDVLTRSPDHRQQGEREVTMHA
jgi:hypothetical protein